MRKSEAGAVLLSPLGVREALMRRHVWLGGVTLATLVAVGSCKDDVGLTSLPETYIAVLNGGNEPDRKSTRLNSSHSQMSYAVFRFKKKKTMRTAVTTACTGDEITADAVLLH